MTIKRWSLVLVICFLVGGLGVMFLLRRNAYWEEYNKYEDRGVPRVEIKLNGVDLKEIDGANKDVRYNGNELAIYNNGEILNFSNVELKGRGNGTWVQEKKPYQIKFEQKEDLFGMGKARKWYLLANALDTTNVRTELAFYVESMLGMEYVYKGEFVELYVDGDYRGLYYLTHAVEVGKNTVDLKDPFGVLVELDNIYGAAEKNYITGNGDILVPKDLVAKDNEEEVMTEFLRDFNELEKATTEKNYQKINKLVDVDSFAKYYLLSEFTVNPDAYWTSFYFYKDGTEDKIHAGPGWDFDLTFGNRRWGNWLGERFYSPRETMIRKQEILPKEMYELEGIDNVAYEASLQISELMFKLMEVPEFRARVSEIFNERLSGREEELMEKMNSALKKTEKATVPNNEKWGKVDLVKEIEDMKEWIRLRCEFFEEEYGNGEKRNLKLL